MLRVDASEDEITVETALDGVHNANGLAWGSEGETVLNDASGGALQRLLGDPFGQLEVDERIQLDSGLDNPSYYHDHYDTPGIDASMYILAGALRGVDLGRNCRNPNGIDPWVVWSVKKNENENGTGWEKKVLVEDDGRWMRSASTALIVGIDPKENGGRKQGWLVVAGLYAEGIGMIKVDL